MRMRKVYLRGDYLRNVVVVAVVVIDFEVVEDLGEVDRFVQGKN